MINEFEFTFGPQRPDRDHRLVSVNGKIIGFQPKDKTNICVERCPVCDRENYAMSVLSGICCWCGWNANEEFERSGEFAGNEEKTITTATDERTADSSGQIAPVVVRQDGQKVVERLKNMKPSSRLFCTRFFQLKRHALSASRWFERNGATNITLAKSEPLSQWRLRCCIEISKFAEFCADEARRESRR